MKKHLLLATPLLITAFVANADNQERYDTYKQALEVDLNNCTEFAGVSPINEIQARALVPSKYKLVVNGTKASLVVRVSDCQEVSVNGHPGKPGRVAHIGVELISPDGTATDPNTSINNYTLSYASNIPELVEGLNRFALPAVKAPELDYEFAPPNGPSLLYASVAPLDPNSPAWFLYGTVTNPTIPSPFLANWWYLSNSGQVKMATTFPKIYFDFTSTVSFYTSSKNIIGTLIGGNSINNFPVSFRGQYTYAQMIVTLE